MHLTLLTFLFSFYFTTVQMVVPPPCGGGTGFVQSNHCFGRLAIRRYNFLLDFTMKAPNVDGNGQTATNRIIQIGVLVFLHNI
uniref:Secreted protein n=1 Tax=Acrobeloides nanus TaxID=290746 RepID=A0A914CTL1_9BILA